MCEHNKFEADVRINRRVLEAQATFSADVTIRCAECLLPFGFLGLPQGLLLDKPTISFSGFEAKLPIYPGNTKEQPNNNGIGRAILMPPQADRRMDKALMLPQNMVLPEEPRP